jgi:hypothetical protein
MNAGAKAHCIANNFFTGLKAGAPSQIQVPRPKLSS